MPVSGVGITPGQGGAAANRVISGSTIAMSVDTSPWPETPINNATAFSVGTTALGTTGLSIQSTVTHVYVSVEPSPNIGVRFWNTGGVPTATVGHYLGPGAGPIEITNAQLLQVVSASTTAATIQLSQHTYV